MSCLLCNYSLRIMSIFIKFQSHFKDGWESQSNVQYNTQYDAHDNLSIMIQQFCNNLYIARQLSNETTQYLSNWRIKNTTKKAKCTQVRLFYQSNVHLNLLPQTLGSDIKMSDHFLIATEH